MQGLSRARALGAFGAIAATGPLVVETALAAGRADAADLKLLATLLSTANAGVALYNGAITANVLSPAVAVAISGFANDHAAHRDALVNLISAGGGIPGPSSDTPAPAPPKADAELLVAALAFERTAASTYLTSLSEFKDRTLAKTAGAALGVVASHVALLAEALRQNPAFPGGFVT